VRHLWTSCGGSKPEHKQRRVREIEWGDEEARTTRAEKKKCSEHPIYRAIKAHDARTRRRELSQHSRRANKDEAET
jgi:hypothetical protein